jgi:hypothetical protein
MAACAVHVKAGCGGCGILRMRVAMVETQDEKKARLAQALRDNLRRRKAQSREAARGEEANPPPPPDMEA